jgi:hypothetical protein
MVETEGVKRDARGMAGFCAFGGIMVGVGSMILTVVYALHEQPQTAGIFMIASAISFGLMSNAFFRK